MFKRDIPKIVPIAAIASLRNDGAIAQTTQQPQPSPKIESIDAVSAIGYLLAATVGVVTLAPKLIEKWFDDKQKRSSIQADLVKSDAEIELEAKRKELESAAKLADFYYSAAKESREKESTLLMLFVTKELDASMQTRDQLYDLIENQKKTNERIEKIEEAQKHSKELLEGILNVLNMRDRS